MCGDKDKDKGRIDGAFSPRIKKLKSVIENVRRDAQSDEFGIEPLAILEDREGPKDTPGEPT